MAAAIGVFVRLKSEQDLSWFHGDQVRSVSLSISAEAGAARAGPYCMWGVWDSGRGAAPPGSLHAIHGPVNHCLTWLGSGLPGVCAMKSFLLDARCLLSENCPPQN